ncbi:MAG: DUF3299 domain-containing protein [Gammaproteobacteria bacterium]|nr:DUF3299 domain-containing protein [Gammaproteobacteria bacterium]
MLLRTFLLITYLVSSPLWAAAAVSDWEQLIPPQYNPKKIMERHGVRYLDLSKPDQKAIFDEIEQARRLGPVEPTVNGSQARLRGFVVPLDGDGEATTEFLLVPEYGYCIHVPPPPANQLILVRVPNSRRAWPVFSEVEVSGNLRIETAETGNGRAGYVLTVDHVVPVE